MKTYSTGQFAQQINKTVRTIQKWDKSGKLKAYRTPTNRRYYTQAQLNQYFGHDTKPKNKKEEQIYLYGRVSSPGQKLALKRQVEFLAQFANARGYQIHATLTDIGSGMNYKRKNWNKLVQLALSGQPIKVVVAYPDRFIRFGFNWFQQLFQQHGSSVEVINQKKLAPNEELVQDLISIIQVFSSKFYGLSKYKNKIKKDDELK